MRIPSGVTDQYIPFVAVDATDLKTRETGLTGFTVYRSRNGGTATAYTTPTVVEASSSNMPGEYWLLLDEDMTIGSGNDSEQVLISISHASMARATLTYELYRRDVTSGETLTVASGAVSNVTTTATATAVTTVNGLAAGVITAASIASSAFTSAKFASGAFDAVWSVTARLLTAGTNIVLAKGTGVTGFNDPTANDNADALLDRAAGVETGLTIRQAMRLFASVLIGKASGLATTTAVYRDFGDTKDRITATVDTSGNRTAVTRDAT